MERGCIADQAAAPWKFRIAGKLQSAAADRKRHSGALRDFSNTRSGESTQWERRSHASARCSASREHFQTPILSTLNNEGRSLLIDLRGSELLPQIALKWTLPVRDVMTSRRPTLNKKDDFLWKYDGAFVWHQSGFPRVEASRLRRNVSQLSENKLKEHVMKKIILLAGTALVLAGCNQGGTSDEYNTDTGTANSSSTNYNTGGRYGTNSSGMNSGGATSPGGMNSGSSSSGTTDTNNLNSGSSATPGSDNTGTTRDANQAGGGTGTPP
jgi:hypothetical protein